jgi:hypothetical protein
MQSPPPGSTCSRAQFAMGASSVGNWLSNDPNYGSLIRDLCASDPRLRQRDIKSLERRTPWPAPRTRVALFEAPVEEPFGSPLFIHSAVSLQKILDGSPEDGACNKRRLIVVEGLSPEYIDVLGPYFDTHPSFFADHERWCGEAVDAIPLPTAILTQEHVRLEYVELIHLDERLLGKFRIFCAKTARAVSATRILGEFSDVGSLERKCSVWRRERLSAGWDCTSLTPTTEDAEARGC